MARPLSKELIAEIIPRGRSLQATSVEEIQQRVAEGYGISRAELVGSSRAATPLRARQVAIFLTRELTDLSLPQIGRLYGGRDHSTVLNSLRRPRRGPTAGRESPGLTRRYPQSRRATGLTADGTARITSFPQPRPQARNPVPTRFPPRHPLFPQALTQLKKASNT
jgi:hypothetical protein